MSVDLEHCITCGAVSVDADVDGYRDGTCPQCFDPYRDEDPGPHCVMCGENSGPYPYRQQCARCNERAA